MAEQGSRKYLDVGLLILRLGIGGLFIVHGWPKLAGGVAMWKGLGANMHYFGVTYAFEFWGFMCAFVEAVGGAFLVLGVLVRPFAALMLINMIVATVSMRHMSGVEFGTGWSRPLEMGVVFLSLLIMGGGSLGLGRLFRKSRK